MKFRDIETFEELGQVDANGNIAVTDTKKFDCLCTELCILCRFIYMCKVSAGLKISEYTRLMSMRLIGETDFDCFSQDDKLRASLLLAQRVALYEDLYRYMSEDQYADYNSTSIFLGGILYELGLFEPWETFLKASGGRIIPEGVSLEWNRRRTTIHWLGNIARDNYLV